MIFDGYDGQERRRPRTPTTGVGVMPQITPNLWFDTQGQEAAEFYVSVFPNSKITNVTHYGEAGPRPAGTVLTVDFVLDGPEYTIINGGPEFTFDEAISLLINCADQEEVDYYWTKLSEGGEEGPCGWLKDKYGLSWQIIPKQLGELLTSGTTEQRNRTMEAMLKMVKIDIKVLEDAHRSE
jgi:predicted 3-demethylubiquinone-9 3-methyltransferase (glyoxalase superfamily)